MYSLDRIENGVAVLIGPNGEKLEIPQSRLPLSAKDGDMLVKTEGGFELDGKATESRQRLIEEKLNKILHKHK